MWLGVTSPCNRDGARLRSLPKRNRAEYHGRSLLAFAWHRCRGGERGAPGLSAARGRIDFEPSGQVERSTPKCLRKPGARPP
jgi:hypothetical protein